MNPSDSLEQNLDPQNWDAMRALGHRMVDDMMTYLETLRERPVWQPIADEAREFLRQPPPMKPTTPEAVYDEFTENILPYPLGNIHPRFWGWVIGTGTPMGALAEMLAATMNPNLGGGDHAANQVELQVIEWFKTLFDFPAEASGILTSGGSMANTLGLTVARNITAEFDIRHEGLSAAPRTMRFYASTEAHSSVKKAAEMLGLGSDHLRLIPVDENFEMVIPELEKVIAEDRAAGYYPFAVVGNAGTVNTGAVDDLEAIADICQREKLWFHVDGAFGAMVALSPELKPMVKGMERADSLAFDLHKWLYIPIEVGCVLVRREPDHFNAFATRASYLASHERGAAGGTHWFSDYGIQLSRGFRALKVWMSLREHGIEKYGQVIAQNVAQTTYLAQLVDAAPELERLAPVPMNIVCFRYLVPGMDDEALNSFNKELLMRLHESGVALPTYTVLKGKYVIRVAHVNHRSRRDDFDMLVEAVVKIGNVMREEMGVGV